jgi:hypothetical protein
MPSATAPLSPAKQFESFLARYSPEMQRVTRAALAKMRARLPGAVEMVYDNYQWLVIGFGPAERASEAVFSLALTPRWATLCFLLHGPKIPDPDKLLRGSGTRVRHIRLMGGANDLDTPAVKTLMSEALKLAGNPFDKGVPRAMVIKAVATKRRPRRVAANS